MLPRSITALLTLLALASALPLQDMRLASGGESTSGLLIGGRSDKLDNAPPTSGLPPSELPPIGEGGDEPKHAPAPGWLPPHVHKPTFKFPPPPKGGEPTGDTLPLSRHKHSGDAEILSMPIPVQKSNWDAALSTIKDNRGKPSP